jgi:hypothetical protein
MQQDFASKYRITTISKIHLTYCLKRDLEDSLEYISIVVFYPPVTIKRQRRNSYPCNRPWWHIWMRDVEAFTISRQSAHRWRWCCEAYSPAVLYRHEDSWYSFLLQAKSTPGPYVRLEGLGQLKNSCDLIGNWTRDLLACNVVPRPTTPTASPPPLLSIRDITCLGILHIRHCIFPWRVKRGVWCSITDGRVFTQMYRYYSSVMK